MTVGKTFALVCLWLAAAASVQAQLKADFTAGKTGGFSPLVVKFVNTSNGVSADAVYTWNFGNGNISSLQHPSAIFTEEKQ